MSKSIHPLIFLYYSIFFAVLLIISNLVTYNRVDRNYKKELKQIEVQNDSLKVEYKALETIRIAELIRKGRLREKEEAEKIKTAKSIERDKLLIKQQQKLINKYKRHTTTKLLSTLDSMYEANH